MYMLQDKKARKLTKKRVGLYCTAADMQEHGLTEFSSSGHSCAQNASSRSCRRSSRRAGGLRTEGGGMEITAMVHYANTYVARWTNDDERAYMTLRCRRGRKLHGSRLICGDLSK
jgi:hypothetical protein